MTETPYQAQRRKLHEMKDKQENGEATPNIHPKAQARRDAEAASKKKVSKKKVSKKTASA